MIEPDVFDSYTILFSHFFEFQQYVAKNSALAVFDLLNDVFHTFDEIILGYMVYKMESISDLYMVSFPVTSRYHA